MLNNNTMNNNFAGSLRNNSINKAQELVNNGTISLSALLNMKEVDMSQCQNPISVMHKIYNPISEVGLVTNVCTNVYAVDVTNENGFNEFKSALKQAQDKKEAEHVPYESIWVEGYNMFTNFNFKDGKHFVYYVVTNVEMRMLAKRLSALNINKLTVEEAQLIQSDLPAIIRAWQESSIDVSKDKDKVFEFNFKQFFANITTMSSFMKKNRKEMDFGFKTITKAKKDCKDIPNFKFNVEGMENVAMDTVGLCNMAFAEATEDYLNNDGVKDIYALSNNDVLKPFTNYAVQYPEMALVLRNLFNIVNNAFRHNLTIDEAILNDMRNYVYTKAIELTVDKYDVIKIAIATAMSKVYTLRTNEIVVETDMSKYNAAAVKQIFPNEYIETFAGVQHIQLTIADCEDIEDGQVIEFVNGMSIEEDLCELEEDFTGIAYELDGKLVYDVDAYEFEICNAFVLDKTYKEGTTAQDIKLDAEKKTSKAIDTVGKYAIEKITNAKTIKVTGASAHIVKADDEFVGRILPSKELKGEHTLKGVFSLPSENGQQQLAFVVLN